MDPSCYRHRYGKVCLAHSQLHSTVRTRSSFSDLTAFSFSVCDQALDLLVSVSSTHYCAYTPDLSPCSLQGVLLPYDMGYLILRWVSRLDAFSVYPFRTSLPSCAAGATTGAQLVRSSRSSRTKDKSSQISYAHDG